MKTNYIKPTVDLLNSKLETLMLVISNTTPADPTLPVESKESSSLWSDEVQDAE